MKRSIAAFAIVFVLVAASGASAQTRGGIILKDTIYGLLTGAIIGSTLMLVQDQPEDHLDYIGYGAAAGAILGTAFGYYEATELAVFTVEDGEMTAGIPSIRPELIRQDGQAAVRWNMDILKVAY